MNNEGINSKLVPPREAWYPGWSLFCLAWSTRMQPERNRSRRVCEESCATAFPSQNHILWQWLIVENNGEKELKPKPKPKPKPPLTPRGMIPSPPHPTPLLPSFTHKFPKYSVQLSSSSGSNSDPLPLFPNSKSNLFLQTHSPQIGFCCPPQFSPSPLLFLFLFQFQSPLTHYRLIKLI